MKKRFVLLSALLVIVLVLSAWWLLKPRPGESVFANYVPRSLGKTWTITGSPGSEHVAFVDPTGAIQPRRDSYSVHCFVFDRAKHKLYSPLLHNVRCQVMLKDRIVPSVTWRADGIRWSQTVFASADTCYSRVVIKNEGRDARRMSAFVTALPYRVIGPMQSGFAVTCDTDSRTIAVDDKVIVASETRPSRVGAISGDEGMDITSHIRNGMLPQDSSVRGEVSGASGAMRFDLDLGPGSKTELHFRLPLIGKSSYDWIGVPRVAIESALAEYDRLWESRLGRVELQLPDRRVTDCFDASLAYLVMLSGDGRPMPGAARYRSFWVRDAAYMTDALYYAGQTDMIKPALAELRTMQLPNGGFMPKTGSRSDSELDAPGEAIYAFVQNYRRTGDVRTLNDDWPSIVSACRYIRGKRVTPSGILPASVSAEDLGRGDQQHYWDDFWAVRGLRDAAFAARKLGKTNDAVWIQAEADSLLRATLASARSLRTSYIPNGPEDLTSSAMARGTSCALWPCAVLDVDDPLTKASFDVYWDKWIAPSKGGFVHKDHFWPYAGLDLAQGYLMLGQRERAWTMLDWTLKNDPTRGFYSWPEGMFRNDLTLAEGDMPHGWMCASYVSLVRNMLVRESGEDLVLLSGVPKHWLRSGAIIEVRGFPTEFGKVSYRAEASQNKLKLTISGAKPTGIYRVSLPGNRQKTIPAHVREVSIPL